MGGSRARFGASAAAAVVGPGNGRTYTAALRPEPERPRMTDHHADVVDRRLAALIAALPGRDVVDVGGGSGTRAVPLAQLGCRVTVVDSSTDALASLSRRATEAGVAGRVLAIQADADQLVSVAGSGSADLVLLHGVVGDVDDPVAVLAAAVQVLRPGGRVSVLVPGRLAALVRQAFAGRYGRARDLLRPGPTAGHRGPTADGLYDVAALESLLSAAGLRAETVEGVGVLSGLAGAAGRPLSGGDDLDALEDALGAHPVGRELAVDLHAIAVPVSSPQALPPDPGAG